MSQGKDSTRKLFKEWLSEQEGASACWLWPGPQTGKGYCQIWDGVRLVYAHRYAYEHLVGPIPAGLQIDHVRARGCNHRNCANPAHMEPVTCRTNVLRGIGVAALNAQRTHCPKGHGYTPDNTCVCSTGKRICRTCNRERMRKHRAKKANATITFDGGETLTK